MGIENHKVPVIRIEELLPHPNADTLSLVKIDGYQVVVKTADWKADDLGVYIQPDSVVPEKPVFSFLWEGKTFDGVVNPKYRRITVRKFRKEWSEGLLLPLVSFELKSGTFVSGVKEWTPEVGTDLAELLEITHYEPPEDPGNTQGENERGPGSAQNKIFPRSLKGWYYFLLRILSFGLYDPNGKTGGSNQSGPDGLRPVYDVESFKNFKHAIQPGELVTVTEKIHGSNARYTFQNGKMYAGSRKLWKSPKSTCIWRRVLKEHEWIEKWCQTHPGCTLYGEVVQTQGGFDYGCKDGQTKFFLFDILGTDGIWWTYDQSWKEEYGLKEHWAPILMPPVGFDDSLIKLSDGQSFVLGAKHIREGVVIRLINERTIRGLGRPQVKIVSNAFLEKDSK